MAEPAVDLSAPRRIHVVGAGGAGMGGIATILVSMGHRVSGSDRADSPALRRLADRGITVWAGHQPSRLAGTELVTTSTAVPASDPELFEAGRLGVPVLPRAVILASICATRRTVAVAGTKGKSTTTAMLAAVLSAGGFDPSFLVGADVRGLGGGARWVPTSEWLVVEADESDGTFLRLPAESVVVTNVEADHLDYYGSLDAVRDAFQAFVAKAPGPRVIGVDSEGSAALAAATSGVATYGTSGGAWLRADRVEVGRFWSRFRVTGEGAELGTVELRVPGEHNVRNACGAIASALRLGVGFATAAAALGDYREVARRFEWRAERGGVTFVDDYAHLPSALRAALATARAGGWERVVAVFQPHLYSRTELLGDEMGAALAGADLVVVTDVYGAREDPRPGVTGAIVADAARRAGADVRYVAARDGLAAAVGPLLRPGDLCLSLGAGDITSLTDELGDRS